MDRIRIVPVETGVCQLHLDPAALATIQDLNAAWQTDFGRFVDPEGRYPYTLAPRAALNIRTLLRQALTQLEALGWHIQSWRATPRDYVMGVLRRVMIPDAYEPVFFATGRLADFLARYAAGRPRTVRAFFTGAGVAEKSLLIQLARRGVDDVNLITTDAAAESAALAAINIELWNQTRPADVRYTVVLVQGAVPPGYYERPRTVVVQVCDARTALFNDARSAVPYALDGVLLDNALPYVPHPQARELLNECVLLGRREGFFLAISGLNAGVRVKINPLVHAREIIRGGNRARYAARLTRQGTTTVSGACVDYHYRCRGDCVIINRIFSEGGARIYDWAHHLLVSGRVMELRRMLGAIRSAANLSKASDIVLTSPARSHTDLLRLADEHRLPFTEHARPGGWNGSTLPMILDHSLVQVHPRTN